MPVERIYEFREVVAKVEERFNAVLDEEAAAKLGALGAGDKEGKYEPKMVSAGWFVVLRNWGVAIYFGRLKPDIEPGDTLVLEFRKMPKPPEAPTLPVAPPAPPPPPIGVRAQLENLVEMSKGSGPETEARAKAMLDAFDSFTVREPTS